MACLDEQTVVAFVNGALGGSALAEVERHLVGCETCAALVALAAPDAASGRPRAASVPPKTGVLVGRYRLLRLVGRGGIGEVYAAHDPELDRKVAIKILRADANPDDIGAARLQREAQAVAKLSHPNVVAIYDVGTAAGRVFLTMELVEGETLAAWLDRERRSRDEIVAMFLAAARGLAAAHRAGIIHRDFKPQNVMVARDGTPRVMDFGLAAVAAANAPRLTRVGSILGTPLYMAPEQLLGKPVDQRADQYGFCVALYEALYGERPFDGSDFGALRAAVLSGRPRPPRLGAGVPRPLRSTLLRGLAVDRDRRFPDMDALSGALARATRRRSTLTASIAALSLSLLGVAGALVWQNRGRSFAASPCAGVPARLAAAWATAPEDPRRRDTRAAFLASGEPDAAERYERTSQALDAYVNALATLYNRGCDAATPRGPEPADLLALRAACLDEGVRELGALTDIFAHADGKVVRRAVRAALALRPVEACADAAALKATPPAPQDTSQRARVADIHARLVALRAQSAAGDDWQALRPLGALTDEARAIGFDPLLTETLLVYARVRAPFDPDGAVPLYEEAWKRAEAMHGDEVAAEAAIRILAIVGGVQHHFDVGEHWARIAETVIERGAIGIRLRASFFDARGALAAARGEWRPAAADFAGAIAVRGQGLGPQHPDLAPSLVNQARAKLALGEPALAVEAANRALAISSAVYPADAYETAAARVERGLALVALDRPIDARADLDFARESFERQLGGDHPFLADPLTGLGEVNLTEGRPADARAVLEKAWELRSTHLADGGAREQTAFDLARAIWESAPQDRPHALELAAEAQEGYAAIPDLASRHATVERWLTARHAPNSRAAALTEGH
jgi:tetratricopeptide (TPR) repeat protein/predicted Ser/Thr protein kinase